MVPEGYAIGRDCYFENNAPVNTGHWEYFKNFPNQVKERFPMQMIISGRDICQTWNNVKHIFNNSILRNSYFQFESFCRNNGIRFAYSMLADNYVISVDENSIDAMADVYRIKDKRSKEEQKRKDFIANREQFYKQNYFNPTL